MLKIDSRKVNFYELTVSTTAKDYPNPNQTSSKDFIAAIVPHLYKGMEISKGKLASELTDFNWDSKTGELALLINKTDPELSDVSYKDITTKARRKGDKKETEAIELSSHILIKSHDTNLTAQLRMTMGAGVYVSHLVNLLNNQYRSHKKTSASIQKIINRPHPLGATDKKGKILTYEVRHKIAYLAEPNTELKEILSTGTLRGLDLIESTHTNFDTNSPYEIVRHTLYVDTGNIKLDIKGIRKIIQTGSLKHNISADRVKIEYEDANGNPGNKSLNVNQLDEAFTKTVVIELDKPHNQQQTTLSQEIISKLSALG